MNCRICQAKTKEVISFGRMPQANGFLTQITDRENFFNLVTVFCPSCCMVQLKETLDKRIMFGDDYSFISSTSTAMARHFEQIATDIWKKISKKKKPFVVELGCNDGIMLKHLAKRKVLHLGVEPATNVAGLARQNGVNVLGSFFNEETAKKIKSQYGQADVICGSNVFCHIEDLPSVFAGIQTLLKVDGVAFFEDPYMLDILKKSSFDQIYDEHVYYFSGHSVRNLAKCYGLKLMDMRHQEVHGGSMRYFLTKDIGAKQTSQMNYWLSQEKKFHLDRFDGYKRFGQRIVKICRDLHSILLRLKRQGKTVYGYGATSKSTTTLTFANIGPDLLSCICDTTPTKIGKFTPGMHIPVVDHARFVSDQPNYTLLLAWNHKNEIFAKEADYRKAGGKFITYFPKIQVE